MVRTLLWRAMCFLGTRRAPGRHSRAHFATRPTTPAPLVPVRLTGPVAGDGPARIRPYWLAHECRQQRRRHRTLYLATVGIDLGPRRIHGLEVAA